MIVSATRPITDPSGLLYLEREDAAVSAFVNRIRIKWPLRKAVLLVIGSAPELVRGRLSWTAFAFSRSVTSFARNFAMRSINFTGKGFGEWKRIVPMLTSCRNGIS